MEMFAVFRSKLAKIWVASTQSRSYCCAEPLPVPWGLWHSVVPRP